MGRFPNTTHFFINAWTWGYEDLFTAIAAHFGDKVSSSLGVTPTSSHEFPDPRGPLQTQHIFSPFTRRIIKSCYLGHVLNQVPRVRAIRSVCRGGKVREVRCVRESCPYGIGRLESIPRHDKRQNQARRGSYIFGSMFYSISDVGFLSLFKLSSALCGGIRHCQNCKRS